MKRQYVGCPGKITNAVNVVYATYATSRGHAIVGARLYLPVEWAEDARRRRRAGIPDEVTFATKPELACQILAELQEQGRLPVWITGDEVYGNDPPCAAGGSSIRSATCSACRVRSPSPWLRHPDARR